MSEDSPFIVLIELVGWEFGQGIAPIACFYSKMSRFLVGITEQLELFHSSGMESLRGIFTCVCWLILAINWDFTRGYGQTLWSLIVAYISLDGLRILALPKWSLK